LKEGGREAEREFLGVISEAEGTEGNFVKKQFF